MPMSEEHSELVWLSPLSVFVFVSIIIILGPVFMSSSQVNHHCNYILLYK